MFLVKVILEWITRFTAGSRDRCHFRLSRFLVRISNISGGKDLWRLFRLSLLKVLIKTDD